MEMKDDNYWKAKLTSNEYKVLREKGTESPFSGKYDVFFENGIYSCKGCGKALFTSAMKYDSGCGWPAFFEEEGNANIKRITDYSHGMVRTEILCSNCNGHLGHVFENDPSSPNGVRYCVNSVSLTFNPD